MGPCDLGSSMATQAVERSKSEGTLSSSTISSGSYRFGACTGASSRSIDAGFGNRTVPVAELLAFRNRDGKASDKHTPAVFQDSMLSSIPPTVASSGFSLSDGLGSSAGASRDLGNGTSSFSTMTTGLKPSSSSSSSGPFVFSAGAVDLGPLKPRTQTNVFPGCHFLGSRPASQSDIATDGLFSRTPGLSVHSNVSSDSSILGPMRPAYSAESSNDASFEGFSEPIIQSNVLRGSLSSVPHGPAAAVSSSTAPCFAGSSTSSSQPKFSADSYKSTQHSNIPFEELLSGNTVQGVVGGLPNNTIQRNTISETDQGVSVDISQKLNQLDIDKGVNLYQKLINLGLDEDRKGTGKSAAFSSEAEVRESLQTLDIGKGDTLPLKMEKLALHMEGLDSSVKNTSIFGGQSSYASGYKTANLPTFIFAAGNTRVVSSAECTENQPLESPPASNISSFKFSAEGETKQRVPKVKKSRFRHHPLRSNRESNGRRTKSTSTTCCERSEAAAAVPSSSSDGVSMDFHSGRLDFNQSVILENDEVDRDGSIGGASNVKLATELEDSIHKIETLVSELNFCSRSNRGNETSSSVPLSNVMYPDSSSVKDKSSVGVLSSAGSGHDLKGIFAANAESVERLKRENDQAEQGSPMNEVIDREDVKIVHTENSVADRNEDEASCGPESLSFIGDAKPGATGEEQKSPFTFTASPVGLSTSNLRRRTRKALKTVGRVPPGDKAPVPVLHPDRRKSTSVTKMKSEIRSDTANIGGVLRSGYREVVNAPGGAVGFDGGGAEQVCERWRLRGNHAYSNGEFVKAEEFYSLGVESVSPHETSQSCIRASMLCYSNRAATRMVVGRMREALADCMHAMAVDPSFFRVRLRAAGCHLALGETELAATAYKECLRHAQDARKVDLKFLGNASEGLKKSQQVADCLVQVRKNLYSNASGDSVSALRLVNEALVDSPQSEWLLQLKVHTLISLQRYTEAVQVCTQSLALAEKNFPIMDSNRYENSPLGWRRRMTVKANFHLGKLEEVLEQLQQLPEGPYAMFPPNSDLAGALSAEMMTLPSMELIRDLLHHKLEGNKAFHAGKFSEALEHYTAALARNGESRPFCAVCLCNRAAASQGLGHIADAIADCSRALALDPQYVKAISRRASLYEKVRDYGQSCSDLWRLIGIYDERKRLELQGVKSRSEDGSAGPSNLSEEELQQVKGRIMKVEEEMKKGIPLDHYSILGLELNCSASDIKKAYRKAALRHHPDKAGQFLMRGGDLGGDDPVKDAIHGTFQKDGDRLIDEVRKDSEQLFKLIGEAYAVLSDPAKRSRYDSEEDLRKFKIRSSDISKNSFAERNQARASDGANVQAKDGWNSSRFAGEPASRSRASRQRGRWDGFNYQYQRWHPAPDAAQPDLYARKGRSTGSTYGSSDRSTSWRWEEYPWDDV